MPAPPIKVTIHAGINGHVGGPLAAVTIDDPRNAPARIVALLRELADVIETEPELFGDRMTVAP